MDSALIEQLQGQMKVLSLQLTMMDKVLQRKRNSIENQNKVLEDLQLENELLRQQLIEFQYSHKFLAEQKQRTRKEYVIGETVCDSDAVDL